MPLYEYSCRCGTQFERLARMDAPAPMCPDCAGKTRKRIARQTGFALKGSGWFADGYAKKAEA